MDLKVIHDLIDQISNRSQNGWFSPGEKDRALHQTSLMLFDACYAKYAVDQDAQDDLAPFLKRYDFTNSTCPGGLITLPDDYQHYLGGYIQGYDNKRQKITYQNFDVVNKDELADRVSSQLMPIEEWPVAEWMEKGTLQLWPKVSSAGYISYLKYPNPPEFVYTMSGREIVYDAGNSTQLEWDESNQRRILMGAMQLLGITIDGDKIISYMENLKQ